MSDFWWIDKCWWRKEKNLLHHEEKRLLTKKRVNQKVLKQVHPEMGVSKRAMFMEQEYHLQLIQIVHKNEANQWEKKKNNRMRREKSY